MNNTEAAKLFASIGGRSRSKKKQKAVRKNGKLGGRPKKKKEGSK